MWVSWCSSTCDRTPSRWGGPTQPSVDTCATPGDCSNSSTSWFGVTSRLPTRSEPVRSNAGSMSLRTGSSTSEPRKKLDALRAPIDGHEVMSYLGIPPGRVVGELMDMLVEKRIEDGPYERNEAFAAVREWAIANDIDDPGVGPE